MKMTNLHLSMPMAVWLLSACAPIAAQSPAPAKMPAGTNVNSDAKLMATFKAKVDAYLNLRKSVEGKPAKPVQSTANAKELIDAPKALAAHVRVARATAKRGDIFTPATAAQFRRLLNPSLKGSDGPENKEAIKDDAPEPRDIPFQINGEYPRTESLSTVPPDVLKALPPLPPEIQYRFVGPHLILYDTKANIIVDYMLNAMPPAAEPTKK